MPRLAQLHEGKAFTAYQAAVLQADGLPHVHILRLAAAYSLATLTDDVDRHRGTTLDTLDITIKNTDIALEDAVRYRPGSSLPVVTQEVLDLLTWARLKVQEGKPIYADECKQPDWNRDCPFKNLAPPVLRFIHTRQREGGYYNYYFF